MLSEADSLSWPASVGAPRRSPTMQLLSLLLLLAGLLDQAAGQCMSTTLTSTFNSYQCDDATIMSYTGTFVAGSLTLPEEIYINTISSKTIASGDFANMQSINNNTFAATPGTVPKLFMTCLRSNFIHFTNASFTGLDYVEWFAIRKCLIIEIGGGAFSGLGALQSLEIADGHIGSMVSTSFEGVSMYSVRTVFGSGTVNITSTIPTGSTLPENVFVPLDGVTHLNLQGMGIYSIPISAFGVQDSLHFINFTNNKHLNLLEGTFDGLSVMSEVEMYHVEFVCDCSSHVWLLSWADTNHVSLRSDYRCSNLATSLARYKKTDCDKSPIGFWLLEVYWFGIEKILLWIINIVSFIIACIALAYLDKARILPRFKRRPPAKDPQKPRPKGLKRAADKVRRMQRKMNLGWG